MAFQEVILTAKVAKLGAESDVVRVRAGYARNFLIPKGIALEKTKGNLARIDKLKSKRAEREASELNDAQEIARRINKLTLHMELETGETGKAFGSITAADLAEKIKSDLGGKLEVDRHKIVLDHPIKTGGDHQVEVKLHHDVTATFTVKVKTTGGAADAEKKADKKGEEAPAEAEAKPARKSRK
jgi:large subunit ribosomal protein L9